MLAASDMANRFRSSRVHGYRGQLSGLAAMAVGLGAVACAIDPPQPVSDSEQPRTYIAVAVDRSDPAVSESAVGSASAIARFVSIPAFSDSGRVLVAAGASLDLPPPDSCAIGGAQEITEPPLTLQSAVEFLEAGDVAIAAAGATTPLVPHAFPPVGAFASGVLYTTRDRAASALPQGVPYVVTASGSASVGNVHVEVEAPPALASVEVSGTAIKDVTGVRTTAPISLAWTAGDAPDLVYVELFAFDGSSSVVCTFHDEAGVGTVAPDSFSGIGVGRIALHRVRLRHVDSGAAPTGEVRFDFQIGSAVEFAK
jgi:hypothetical protein